LVERLLANLRGQVATRNATPTPTATPTPSLTEGGDVGGALSWVWDLLIGDFNDNPDVAQTIIGSLIGLIPVVDQACDIRDLIANLIALTYHRRYDEFDPWFNLVITLIGAIPELGSVLKGVGKLVRKGVSKLPIDDLVKVLGNLDLLGGLGKMRDLLDDFLSVIDSHAVSLADKAVSILEGQVRLLEKVSATAGWLSTAAKNYVDNLIAATRGALERAATKIRAAVNYLADRFRELVDAVRTRIRKLQDADLDVPATSPTTRTNTPSTRRERPTNTTRERPTNTTRERPTNTTRETKADTTTKTENTDSTKTDSTKTEEPNKSELAETKAPPPPELADLVTNGIARKGEAWGNNIYEGSCAHVAMRNAISATLEGRETYIMLIEGLTQYGQMLKRFGLDPNGAIGRAMKKLGYPPTGGHAIAAVLGEDGVWRYISWGSVELDWKKFLKTIGWKAETTDIRATFSLDQHVKWMTENLTKHFEPVGTSPLLAEVQKEARESVGWIVE
jgi:hypothetical protein